MARPAFPLKSKKVNQDRGAKAGKSKVVSASKTTKVNADRQSMGGKSARGGRKVGDGNNPFQKAMKSAKDKEMKGS